MIAATISSKSQIVLPKHLLIGLGVDRGDKMLIYSDGEELRMKPVRGSIVDLVAGKIKIADDLRGIPFEEVMRVTKERVAKKLAKHG